MSIVPLLSGYTSNPGAAGQASAVLLLAFLATFVCARAYTRLARIRGWRSTHIAGIHTHHLVFGVVIAFTAGAVEFALPPREGAVRLFLAGLFGCGAALALDEFALAVHLQDVYWEEEGRKSVDAVVIAALLFLLLALHTAPLGRAAKLPPTLLLCVEVANLALVLVAALKGKILIAVVGVFVPALAAIGAIRLAEPGSIWARHMYGTRSTKMAAAIERYREYDRVWQPHKEHLRDVVGGKTGRPRQHGRRR